MHAAITAAIISMAKSLHLKVIAEGVEGRSATVVPAGASV